MNFINLNTRKIILIFRNISVVFCLCFTFIGCGSNTSPNNAPNTETLPENQAVNSCDSSISNTSISHDDIQTPQSEGVYIEDCHNNPNYNACIYHHDPFTQDDSLIPEFRNIFNERISLLNSTIVDINSERSNEMRFDQAMRSYQNYAVNITGTINGLLQNEHYNIIDSIRFNQQPNGKWTTPYIGSSTNPNQQSQSVEQVMAYYYLMYQKDWMELNTGRWYASGRNISVTFSSHNYWDDLSNKIKLKSSENLFEDSFSVPSSLNAGLIAHEAGHANFYYSNLSREGSKSNAYRRCRLDSTLGSSKCCSSADGCFKAISEGQSDFYALMMFPDLPLELSLEEYIYTLIENQELESPILDNLNNCDILRDPRANKNLKAEKAFNCSGMPTQDESQKGEIHDMGALYASIWWEIYNHPEVSKKDIATLFSAHLPLVSYDDNFKTVATKIINKARDLFDESREERYACIISQEFTKRELAPTISTAPTAI